MARGFNPSGLWRRDILAIDGKKVNRPLKMTDYGSWFTGFSPRKPTQIHFDERLLDMSICTQEWFGNLLGKHQKLKDTDDTYILKGFKKHNVRNN
ncbi:hypothetical protein C7818_1263 [Leuconostoc mesenteroides]|jgi:hypothetical protein|nr:hypothetical protein C7818_1263 [Leuconostoc mesenteroides]